ncbi:hypothetical protein BH10BAC6_BH10BAC6_12690 [soil metagenome]
MQRLVSIFLAILLSFSSLVPGMDAREIAKISALVDHYRHHIQDHGETDLTFTDFLIQHYGQPGSNQDTEHSELPLMNGHPTSLLLSGPVSPTTILAVPEPPVLAELHPRIATDGCPEGRSLEVFQPPKKR